MNSLFLIVQRALDLSFPVRQCIKFMTGKHLQEPCESVCFTASSSGISLTVTNDSAVPLLSPRAVLQHTRTTSTCSRTYEQHPSAYNFTSCTLTATAAYFNTRRS